MSQKGSARPGGVTLSKALGNKRVQHTVAALVVLVVLALVVVPNFSGSSNAAETIQNVVSRPVELSDRLSSQGAAEIVEQSVPLDPVAIMQVLTQEDGHTLPAGQTAADIVIITLACSADMSKLRELVGSVHRLRDSNIDVPFISIYGFGLSRKEKREISLWRSVELIDGFEMLFLGQKSLEQNSNEVTFPETAHVKSFASVILNAIEIAMRKFKSVLYVRADVHFTLDNLVELTQAVARDGYLFAGNEESHTAVRTSKHFDYTKLDAMGFHFGSQVSSIFVELELQCLRGYHCDVLLRNHLYEAQLGYLQKSLKTFAEIGLKEQEDYNFCYVLFRDDILYSFEYSNVRHLNTAAAKPKEPKSRTVVAFGMPTISVHADSFLDVAPVRIFVPNFLLTITDEEWSRFEYVIYIGFDEEDKFFDDPSVRAKIDHELQQLVSVHSSQVEGRVDESLTKKFSQYVKVSFEYIQFPYSRGWVTYIWNGLFVHAIKDGCDFFYQVNDDLKLITPGWSTGFFDSMKSMQDVGVVGPKDNNNPNLLTQALVSKIHYEIFGRLYPLDIKDWYSDDWLNNVYGDRKRQLSEFEVRNLNDKGTRYNNCYASRYKETLEGGKKIIEDWLLDQHEESKGEKNHGDRLSRELKQGPLIQ